MTNLSSLIERIKRSEGADRELDRAIGLAVSVQPAPAYTASIDAAMTLVEPRALWAHGSMEDGPFARICWPRPDGTFTDSYFETNCATVPLSICACALKARNPSHEG